MTKLFKPLSVIILLISGTFFGTPAFCQEIKIDSGILIKQAHAMVGVFITEDYKAFVKFTYPGLVELMGGEEEMIKTLKRGIQGMKDDGFVLDTCRIGSIQGIVRANDEIHALVSQQIWLKGNGGTLVSNSFLLAITKNNGVNWFFLDAGNLTDEKIKMVCPNFNDDLKIPAKVPPTFIKDK